MDIDSTDTIDVFTLSRTVCNAIDPALEIALDERHDSDVDHTYADISTANELIEFDASAIASDRAPWDSVTVLDRKRVYT